MPTKLLSPVPVDHPAELRRIARVLLGRRFDPGESGLMGYDGVVLEDAAREIERLHASIMAGTTAAQSKSGALES